VYKKIELLFHNINNDAGLSLQHTPYVQQKWSEPHIDTRRMTRRVSSCAHTAPTTRRSNSLQCQNMLDKNTQKLQTVRSCWRYAPTQTVKENSVQNLSCEIISHQRRTHVHVSTSILIFRRQLSPHYKPHPHPHNSNQCSRAKNAIHASRKGVNSLHILPDRICPTTR
jgi:hypothetical protein